MRAWGIVVASRGHGGIHPQSEALPPTLAPPPSQRGKMVKSAIFGKFLNFCLRIVVCPLDSPPKKTKQNKKILVPPLMRNGSEIYRPKSPSHDLTLTGFVNQEGHSYLRVGLALFVVLSKIADIFSNSGKFEVCEWKIYKKKKNAKLGLWGERYFLAWQIKTKQKKKTKQKMGVFGDRTSK